MNTPKKPKQKIERRLQLVDDINGHIFSFDVVIDEEDYNELLKVITGKYDFEVIDITRYPGDSFTHFSIETWTE